MLSDVTSFIVVTHSNLETEWAKGPVRRCLLLAPLFPASQPLDTCRREMIRIDNPASRSHQQLIRQMSLLAPVPRSDIGETAKRSSNYISFAPPKL